MTEPTGTAEPRLALAERADSVPGWPQWIAPALRLSRGLDPLGLQTITLDRIMPLLLPGVLVLSQRARLFSLYPFLVAEYQRLGGATTNTALSTFLKEREFDYAVAVQLCPNGCGDNSAGAVGADRARPAGREAKAGAATVPRQESVESFLGGYGLYYRSPLTDLGVVVARGTPTADGEATPVDVVMPGGLGERLAGAFRAAISDTAYYRRYLRSVERSVPTAALRELAVAACLCRLPEHPGERQLLYEAFFVSQAPSLADACEQRRRGFALFLRELGRDGGVSDSDGAFRAAIWADFEQMLAAREEQASQALANTLAQWAALVAKEYLQEALYTLWWDFCRRGPAAQPDDGFTAAALDALIGAGVSPAATITGDGFVALTYEPGMPTRRFAEQVAGATAGVPLEALRRWAVEAGEAPAALVLLFATIARLPDVTRAPAGWEQIGTQRSERQPGLLRFWRYLERHLEEDPTVAVTLVWMVRHFVIAAHEHAAYSKLPDFTFRFRHEAGRLRFSPLDPGRYRPADMRREAMSSLGEDLGLWERGQSGPRVTAKGAALVRETFG
jgi:hypothetical protein